MTPKRDPLATYTAHEQAILKAVPDAKPDRLIAYVALQMRKEGFSQEVVENTILDCGVKKYPELIERNWKRYAKRMTACIFGIEGDLRLARGSVAKKLRLEQQQEKAAEPEEKQQPRQSQKESIPQNSHLRMR